MENERKSALVCPDCGGEFAASDLLDGDDIVTCLNCGKMYSKSAILNKSDNVRITEIKANAYSDVETTRSHERVAIEQGKRDVEAKQLEYKHQESVLAQKQIGRELMLKRIGKIAVGAIIALGSIGLIVFLIYLLTTLSWDISQWLVGIIVGLVVSIGSIVLARFVVKKDIDWLDVLPNLILLTVVIVNFVAVCNLKQDYIVVFNWIAVLSFVSIVIVQRIQDNSCGYFLPCFSIILGIVDVVLIIIANIIVR